KYKKALRADQDYTYTVQDETGETVTLDNKGRLALNAGTYTLAVTGKGNYTGTIERRLYVSEKQKLIKNAAVTLGKNQKTRPYTGEDVTLTPGYYDAAAKKYYKAAADGTVNSEAEGNANDIFLVKAGKTSLLWGKDYTVSYANNQAVGTATMTVTGIGEYHGTKSVAFKITGTAFSAKTIDVKTSADQTDERAFKASMPYTGRAVTQNKVVLTTKVTKNNPAAEELTYGKHYTITYKNNVKKGTATMTFTAKPESGYTGKFNKTFKIGQQYLSEDMFVRILPDGTAGTERKNPQVASRDEKKHTVTVEWDEDAVHSKGGASLSFALKNEKGDELKQGTDYTVSYKDNKAATKKSAGAAVISGSKQPVMTIKGKGNYAGTLSVQFQIIPASIASGSLTVSAAQVQKKNGMKLKDFKLKATDGKTVLKASVDYTVDESGCTPEIIQAYADSLETGAAAPAPKAVLKGIGNYETKDADGNDVTREILLSDYIYLTKFTAKNIKVEVIGDRTYTGQNVEPTIKVSYYQDNNAKQQGAVGTELTEGKDYTATYGAKNIAAGRNKGSITVTGAGTYGGSVTVKFDIAKKAIY
ncbi:MAG: hypothetical protein NC415_11260, partial [bacterium]|nr:hypothetical protein [bacterium]